MGCHALLQGIFLIQGSSLHLQDWQAGSSPLAPPSTTQVKGWRWNTGPPQDCEGRSWRWTQHRAGKALCVQRARKRSNGFHGFSGILSYFDVLFLTLFTKGSTTSGLPRRLSGKEPEANTGETGDAGSMPGSGRPPGGGNGNLLLYSCLENPMDRGIWWVTVRGVAKNWTQLSAHTHHKKYVLL